MNAKLLSELQMSAFFCFNPGGNKKVTHTLLPPDIKGLKYQVFAK